MAALKEKEFRMKVASALPQLAAYNIVSLLIYIEGKGTCISKIGDSLRPELIQDDSEGKHMANEFS